MMQFHSLSLKILVLGYVYTMTSQRYYSHYNTYRVFVCMSASAHATLSSLYIRAVWIYRGQSTPCGIRVSFYIIRLKISFCLSVCKRLSTFDTGESERIRQRRITRVSDQSSYQNKTKYCAKSSKEYPCIVHVAEGRRDEGKHCGYQNPGWV